MASIASVYVEVLATTSKIADQMEAAFRRVDPIARRAGERWGAEIDRGLGGRHEVKLDADTSKAEADIDKAARDRETTIEVDVDAAGAEAKLDRLARDRRIELKLDIDSATSAAAAGGGGGGIGTAVRDITLGAAAASTALSAMGAAGVGAVGSLASQFGQTTQAVAGLGREISSFEKEANSYFDHLLQTNSEIAATFGHLGDTASEATPQVTNLGGSMKGLSAAAQPAMMLELGAALAGLAGIAAQASQALLLLPAAIGGIGAGIGTLMVGLNGIKDAYSAVNKANASFGADQTSKANAVAAATRTLTSAVRSEVQAQRDVARARKEAGRELEDLNDKLRDGTLNEAQAKLDLQKAQERLANGMFESSSDYEQAQLDVLKAEQAVTEAHKANNRTQEEAVLARKKGVEGSDAVVAATERETAAHESVAAAQKAVDDANAKVSASSTAAATAMAALSPNAQALVYALQGLKPAWDELSKSVQDALTAGMGTTITQLANTYLPMLQTGMTNLATVFNQMFGAISTEVMKPETMAAFQGFLNNVTTAFQNLTPMMGPLVDMFSTLMADGSSFLPGMATAVSNLVIEFSNFITKASESGQLKVWIGEGLAVLTELWHVVKDDLIPMLFELKPVGEFLLPMIVDGFKAMHDLMPVINAALDLLLIPIRLLVDQVKGLAEGWKLVETNINLIKVGFGELKTVAEPIFRWIREQIDKILPDWVKRLIPNLSGSAVPTTTVPGTPVSASTPTPAPDQNAPNPQDRRGDHVVGAPQPAPPNGPSPAAPPGAQPTATQSSGFNWDAVAAQESSGNWSNADTGHNGHYGGLQFSPETWKAYGGGEFSEMPHQTSRENQIIVADRTAFYGYKGLKPQGLGAWEVITQGKVAGVTVNTKPPGAAAPAPAPAAASPSVPTPVTTNTAPAAATAGGYPGDAALLARVPAGRYQNPDENPPGSWDLTKGLGDCSSAVEDLVNILTGSSTAGRSLSTSNAAQWLADHGFVKNTTGANVPGAFNVGYNASHMQATLPGGQNFNYGSNEAAARGGVGGSGAFGEGLTEHYYRPAGTAQDPTYVALSPNIPAGQKGKEKDKDKKSDAEKLGQDLVGGIAEAFGFDGSLFKNPAEFGLVKIFAALSKVKPKDGSKGTQQTSPIVVGPGSGSGGLLDAAGGMIPNIPAPPPDAHLQPTQGIGPGNNGQGGPVINNSVNMSNSSYGYQPGQVGDQIREGQLQNTRSQLNNLPS